MTGSTVQIQAQTSIKQSLLPCAANQSKTRFVALKTEVCFQPGIILCGKLGSKHKLTNPQTKSGHKRISGSEDTVESSILIELSL